MSRLGFVLRQMRADLPVALLLVVVLGVGAFLGAGTPRWIDDRLNEALRETLADASPQGNLNNRGFFGVSFAVPPRSDLRSELGELDGELDRLRSFHGDLTGKYGDDRWAMTLTPDDLLSINGEPVEAAPGRKVGLWLPQHAQSQVTVVDGAFPDPAVESVEAGDAEPTASPRFEVAATADVADALGLEIGDELVAEAGRLDFDGRMEPARLIMSLSGIVEPARDSPTAWSDTYTALEADRGLPGDDPRIYRGSVIADPRLAESLVDWAGNYQVEWDKWLAIEWRLDLVPDRLSASEAESLITDVRRLRSSTFWMTSLDAVLLRYLDSRTSAERAAALGVASLTGLLVTVQLLAIGLLAERRAAALALTRVRGGRDGVLVRALATEALLTGVVGVGLGTAAAALTLGASWLVPVLLLVVTVAGLPVIGVRLARRGATDRPEHATLRPSARRLVAEAGLVVIAVAAVWLLTQQPADSEAGADPVVSLTPLLVAAAAGVVLFRLLPYPVAIFARVLSRVRGATSFIAATRAARAPAYAVLPVIAVLMAVGLAAFGESVRATADQAREVTAWSEVPADAVVTTWSLRSGADELGVLLPDATAIAAGYIARSQQMTDEDGDSLRVDVLAVDVAAWQEVVADAAEPVEPVASLATAATADGAIPAVVKGHANELNRGEQVTLDVRNERFAIQVVGRTEGFAGVPAEATIVVPIGAFDPASLGLKWPNVLYLAGPMDRDQIAAALDADPVLRADVLAAIDDDPLLATTLLIFRVAALVAAVLAATAAVLGLQVTARSRAYALSILRTLGLPSRSLTALIAAEVVPASIIAAAAGAATGLGVALAAGSAIDLAALTGLLEAGVAVVPDVTGTVLAAAGVVAFVVIAVGIAVATNRRARLGAVLRVGERS